MRRDDGLGVVVERHQGPQALLGLLQLLLLLLALGDVGPHGLVDVVAGDVVHFSLGLFEDLAGAAPRVDRLFERVAGALGIAGLRPLQLFTGEQGIHLDLLVHHVVAGRLHAVIGVGIGLVPLSDAGLPVLALDGEQLRGGGIVIRLVLLVL